MEQRWKRGDGWKKQPNPPPVRFSREARDWWARAWRRGPRADATTLTARSPLYWLPLRPMPPSGPSTRRMGAGDDRIDNFLLARRVEQPTHPTIHARVVSLPCPSAPALRWHKQREDMHCARTIAQGPSSPSSSASAGGLTVAADESPFINPASLAPGPAGGPAGGPTS